MEQIPAMAPIPAAIDRLRVEFDIPGERVRRAELGKDAAVWLETDGGKEQRWFRHDKRLEAVFPADDKGIPLCAAIDFADPDIGILSWRPGRRIAIRVATTDGFEVIKGLRPKKLAHAHGAYQAVQTALTASDDFLVPRVRLAPDLCALIMNGLNLKPIAVSAKNVRSFEKIGHALAAFQYKVPTEGLILRGFNAELSVLGDLADRHLRGMGELPEGWDAQRRRLHDHGCVDQHLPLATHRDLHDGQLLADGERVALLDFDLLACASPLLDLGNLSAHFYLRALQGIGDATRADAEACERALLAGYGLNGKQSVQCELRAYKSSTFLRLALVYSMRPMWRELALPLVQYARRCIDDTQPI